ncbi:endonuclease domain-containing protein [Streptomyces niveus]|uniref:endonuclease domain-containing protein n=1 Tax=Streptomyces niveus TaxID=193462 RepID=UPI0034471C3E
MTSPFMPSRKTETRHSRTGKTCHHFMYHRLTCDEFDQLRERAAGRCEICSTPELETGGRRLVIDHFRGGDFHLIRGLLCDACNAVMSCVDGTKRWGENRRWEARALLYEAASWHPPTAEQRKAMDRIQAWGRAQVYGD